jgi:HAD superfamily hydrolase (TIGR01490 family)
MLRAMDTPAGRRPAAAAAFFDLDKTIISRSSTLAFVPSFYRHGLINSVQAARGAFAQLVFRLGGADHDQMQRIKEQVSRLCQGWPVERVTEIVTTNLAVTIAPLIYAEARGLLDAHKQAGRDVIIVSTSGQEMVGPIGAMLGASGIIATQMRHADGRYTGEMEFYA